METTDNNQVRISEMMRAATVALANGDRKRAHLIWRQVASIDPGNENVWLSLLTVVDNDQDRRVCLENIVHLNPSNVQASRQLDDYRRMHHDIAPIQTGPPRKRIQLSTVLRYIFNTILMVLVMIALFILGVAAGVLFNLF